MSDESLPAIRRVRVLLGTDVAITVIGLAGPAAHAAIDRGFAAVDQVHHLMSFHEAGSDLSRLNCARPNTSVRIHRHTVNVLTQALDLSEKTAGVFDVTVAPKLVATGYLPRPAGAAPRGGSWRDIEIVGATTVRLRRPLWIDLGGIAKGYAVDRAVAAMDVSAGVTVIVNAGGDLRVAGPQTQRILLRAPRSKGMAAVIELQDGSLASSSGREVQKLRAGRAVGPHVDARTRKPVSPRKFVSVLAQDCIVADALTKVVLVLGRKAEPVLGAYGAIAHTYNAGRGWHTLGGGEA